MNRSSLVFIILITIWEIAVGNIYGHFIRFAKALATAMSTQNATYYFADDSLNFS